jgi:hypothetical protein
MATTCNTHFATYSSVKNQVTHLILVTIWKTTYNDYVIIYPNSPFHDDTLKDRLQNALEDLKIDTINEEGIRKVVLQFDEVLAQLKAMDNHPTRNVLKWK